MFDRPIFVPLAQIETVNSLKEEESFCNAAFRRNCFICLPDDMVIYNIMLINTAL
jgi:hypothetical protein